MLFWLNLINLIEKRGLTLRLAEGVALGDDTRLPVEDARCTVAAVVV